MQRSGPFTRNTLPASWARNFDGTVSRCFASSVCSKLPLKAKAHVWGSRVDPRWRSGRSPATPDRLCKWECTPQRPTLQHSSHLLSHHGVLESDRGPVFPANVGVLRWVGIAVAAAQRAQEGV